MTPVTGPGR